MPHTFLLCFQGSKVAFPAGISNEGSSSNSQMIRNNHRIPEVVRVPMLSPTLLAEKYRTETLREDAVYEFYLPLPETSFRATVHWMRISSK